MAMRVTVLASCGLLLFVLCACFANDARITVKPSSVISSELTQREVKEATEIVERTVASFGLIENEQVDAMREVFRTSKESPDILITRFDVGPSAQTRDRVSVFVSTNKSTGRFVVMLENRDSMRPTDFDLALERATTNALRRKFPLHDIEVKRRTVGPLIAP